MKWNTNKPMKAAHIYNLDAGAGGNGRLTIMDTATKQFWQSDPVMESTGGNVNAFIWRPLKTTTFGGIYVFHIPPELT